MNTNKEDLKHHIETARKVYLQELGAPEGAIWIMHPRDYHMAGSMFPIDKIQTKELPVFLDLPCVIAHVWRRPPIIALNTKIIKDIIDAEGF